MPHSMMFAAQSELIYFVDFHLQSSGIKISDVSYKDIHGTSATRLAVKCDCSSENPCERISWRMCSSLTRTKLGAQALCNHAGGTALGIVQPQSCFRANVNMLCSGDKNISCTKN
ncbi:Polygalacturonase protein [Spatholobus suberectus]|nr:Polygalacturonase protein [Spatholobus suberectus]